MVPDLVIDAFAGPGGCDIAARALRLRVAGLELDATACQTRRKAGLVTVRCDVSRMLVPSGLYGLIASAPCIQFSHCGDRAALLILAELANMVRDEFRGLGPVTRAGHVTRMTAVLHDAKWPENRFDPRHTAISVAVASATLITEPARYIHAGQPRWVALEQVPAALPVFEVYATLLREHGYSVWCGILNAADYGLGQVRRRAVLIASLDQPVSCPPPTHYDPKHGHQMFGQPWRSMADVIGWGCTDRPSPTVTGGGIKSGGPEPFGHAARRALASEQDAGRWIPRLDGNPSLRPTPAECALLQGFPAGHWFAGGAGKQIQQAGNAVPPPLALAVLTMATGRSVLQEAA